MAPRPVRLNVRVASGARRSEVVGPKGHDRKGRVPRAVELAETSRDDAVRRLAARREPA
jgi:hypothetical protein